ncbi:hypothetical protein J6590_075974 [Homalodisca vitripennis]|nr:hypothetical protein J6590_075974 [Homalodisca vitripennis]
MLIFGDILIQCIIKGTIYEIKNNRRDFWPDIKESDILTKRAQLALLLHNNNFTTLRPDTVAEMMYQMPTPTPTQDLLGYSALKGSIDHTPVSCKNSKDGRKTMDVEFYADSHGRGLPETIGACSGGRIRVSGLVMPGATVCQVYRQVEGALHRPMVIIAGTNNILKKSTEEIYSNLERNLQSLTKERTVHVTTIPNRYDTNPIDPTHHDINISNNYIKEIAVRMDNVHIIDLDELGRDHFTRHGLHLNYRGKKKLSYMIIDSLGKTFKYHKGKKTPKH